MIKAVIFDMDGVLIDSEPVYMEWLRKFLRDNQIEVSEEELMKMVGISAQNYQKNLEIWWRRSGKSLPGEGTLYEIFEQYCAKAEFSPRAVMNPYAASLLGQLRNRGIRIALASSSPMNDIMNILTDTELLPYMDVIVSGADFTESKPNPEIYLYTMARLGLDEKVCIAVEDSEYGIQAAKRAGILVVAKKEKRFGFSQEEADYQIEDLDHFFKILDKLNDSEKGLSGNGQS